VLVIAHTAEHDCERDTYPGGGAVVPRDHGAGRDNAGAAGQGIAVMGRALAAAGSAGTWAVSDDCSSECFDMNDLIAEGFESWFGKLGPVESMGEMFSSL